MTSYWTLLLFFTLKSHAFHSTPITIIASSSSSTSSIVGGGGRNEIIISNTVTSSTFTRKQPTFHLQFSTNNLIIESKSKSKSKSNTQKNQQRYYYYDDINIHESFVEQSIDNNNDDTESKIIQIVTTTIPQYNYNNKKEDQTIIGCLIHKQQQQQQRKDDDDNIHHHEALIQSYNIIETINNNNKKNDIENENNKVIIDSFIATIHLLYKYHLMMKNNNHHHRHHYYNDNCNDKECQHEQYDFIIHFSQENEKEISFHKKLLSLLHFLIPIRQDDDDENNDVHYKIDIVSFIQHLHLYSFQQRGTKQGRIALDIIGILSNERHPFDFQSTKYNDSSNSSNDYGRNLISHQKQIIPLETIDVINNIMDVIKRNGWLSTNPDSVDGLPSLHLNLISGGKPLFDIIDKDNDHPSILEEEEVKNEEVSFDHVISQMTSLLQPFVYDKLLPIVKELCHSETVEISDVFLRNYGSNIQPDGDDDDDYDSSSSEDSTDDVDDSTVLNNSRFGLSPHYDVFSSATCVIALDSTASTGRNGLYTIHRIQDDDNNNNNNQVVASNHAALKQFFPLQRGDGVIHSFDVLHGVDIDPNLNSSRTSLIIWFIDKGDSSSSSSSLSSTNELVPDQPWLSNPYQDDHVKQFIAALASECNMANNNNDNLDKDVTRNENHSLYIKSSLHGNPFALNSLAEICYDGLLSSDNYKKAKTIPSQLSIAHENPFIVPSIDEMSQKDLAKALWFESSIRGNRVAQASLGDSIMEEYTGIHSENLSPYEKEDLLLTACTLFCMASQQGYDVAKEALSHILQIEYSRLMQISEETGSTLDEDDFIQQPIVQTALLSLSFHQ